MPRLPSGARLSDYLSLGVLTTTFPAEVIDAVLAHTGRHSQRHRQLPARLVVYYVLALGLFAPASYGEVLRCLVEGVGWLRLGGVAVAVVSKAAITKARIRLGTAAVEELFRRVAELWRKLGDDEVRKAAYRGGRRTCQNLHEGAIRHERG